MSSTSKPHDLGKVLVDLDDRADHILLSLYVLWDLDNRYALIEKDFKQQDYIDVIRSHTEKMVADLEAMERKNASMNDGEILDWINNCMNDEEKRKKQEMVMKITAKMEILQRQVAEAKKGYLAG